MEDILGIPLRIVTGEAAEVALTSTAEIAVDGKVLIHGGFTFGLADYVTMLTVIIPSSCLGDRNAVSWLL